jgi:outer membrane protein TolC
MKYLHLFIFILLPVGICFSQGGQDAQEMDMTLGQAIQMARHQSFDAFRAENLYLIEVLNYQTDKNLLLPKANLTFKPANYDRSIIEEWDSETKRYKPYEVQWLNSSGILSVYQNVGFTGGSLSLNSSLRRTMTYNETVDDYQNYVASPLNLTYTQNFAAINTFKWRAKIDPLRFEEAKQQYLENVETITIKAVTLFFNLLMADMNYRIALLNQNYADTLYLFGKKKLEIGAITRDEYLRLELSKLNSGISLESEILVREQAQMELNNFLEIPLETEIHCISSEDIPDFGISAREAIAKAMQNNPDMIALKRKLIEADKAVKSAKAKRFDANFSATVGLNQNNEKLGRAYQDLRDRQAVSFTLSVPILNWGENRRDIAEAIINKELVTESSRKEQEAIEIDIIKMVKEFNIKHKQVMASAQADSISRITYQVVNQQFMLGKANATDINLSYKDMQNARNNYLSMLKTYWLQLYFIRQTCLYDFEKKEDLSAALESKLKELESATLYIRENR